MDKTGVSNPAESNKVIRRFLYISKSGYFILNPSVFILVPEGKSILDNLESINDLPLFEFPIIPIFSTFEFIKLL